MTPLLAAENLVKSFSVSTGWRNTKRFYAVDNVSLHVERGRTLAIVGESGCGKSTVGSMLLRLQDPDSGRILLDGAGVMTLDRDGLRRFRRRVQVVFQDPFASLDPRERIRDVLMRPMLLHQLCDKAEAPKRAAALMEAVGLSASQLDRFPHQFSGGQRQRIAIARALSVQPDVIICDEPVSALDVSVQAQVVNLLQDLQRDTGVALIFISHDLSVVRHLAHEVAVMYSGRVVEQGETKPLFERPSHPYTQALLAAAPTIEAPKRAPTLLSGEPPDPTDRTPGCRFAARCAYRTEQCLQEEPALMKIEGEHLAACFLAKTLPPVSNAVDVLSETPAAARIAAYRRARDGQTILPGEMQK
ncbi:ATP-binding cassette domain-containing protein [Neorhizobium sp. P12A]|uniref:ABC transporter ATP-binding protein n=1 Tax=Neorhizobium sp. P12A TaxID=2268027 RepID=UPI0011F06977|nr:oligopeptide/dipeptide ABC transporter ATP-binding protein [Neorhizobium sp. P12A]KAA0683865.1 ATP-binding cassette domain-containing protein [Neorhizobium sp. P12A]